MKRRYWTGIVIVCVLLVGGTYMAQPGVATHRAGVATSEPTNRLRIEFGGAVHDSELQSLLNEYNASPYVVYMAAYGFSGTHQVKSGAANIDIIQQARQKIVQMKEGVDGSTQAMLRRDDGGDFVLLKDGTSPQYLLTAATINREFVENFSDNTPFIYAMDVTGDANTLNKLAADSRLTSAVWINETRGRVMSSVPQPPHDLLPETVQARVLQSFSEKSENDLLARLSLISQPSSDTKPK